ncbi:hypothetical protein ACTD5D_19175 [Nocardia takedensis]
MIDFLLRTLLALTLGGSATALGYCLRAPNAASTKASPHWTRLI